MRWCLRFKYLKCKRALNVIVLFLLSLLITTAVFDHLRARPQRHKTHPGEFLRNNKPSNYTYCNFKHGLPEELAFEESDLEGTPEMGLSSRYKVLYNVLEATRQNSSSVTYSTHATVEFLDYISEIARSWDGPVSLAIFVPDSDAVPVISTLNVLCYCQPDMGKVSVHFVFPAELPPRLDSGVAKPNNCSGVASNSSSVREAEGLIYPVNVCRNVAREAAVTRFVLVADVQLIPSKGLAFKFLEMVASIDLNRRPSKVFVLPLFEVEEGENIPANKEELISMVRDERAVYFHRHVCSHCQKFPGIERWLETTDSGKVTVSIRAALNNFFIDDGCVLAFRVRYQRTSFPSLGTHLYWYKKGAIL